MAKQNKVDLDNLSQRDLDILSLETPAVMKKYKLEKQGVYDRRFALNKKIKAAGLTVDQFKSGAVEADQPAEEAKPKRAYNRKAKESTAEKQVEEASSNDSEVMEVNKQVPVIMKPIEITFENFSIRLNGVPKKISVNPETNAIEIDL